MNRVTIEVRKLDFSYAAKPVLRDINLAIDAGEMFAVLGPSGVRENHAAALARRP